MGWRELWARYANLRRRLSEQEGQIRWHETRQRMNPGMRVRGIEH